MKLGFTYWRCSTTLIPLHNTFFENVQLSFLQVTQLTVLWHFRVGVTMAAYEVNTTEKTAIYFYNYFREACRVVHEHDEQQIGGPRDVDVDESHLFTRKYRGRILRATEQFWVFGSSGK